MAQYHTETMKGGTQPYIGAQVTLISSLDVRYEGVLFTIDPNESTVALQEVRCLGTEDRQTGDKAIEKSDTVYEFIIFRGENIKSICLSNNGKPPNKKPINDPSIIKVGEAKEQGRKPVNPMSAQSSSLRPQQQYGNAPYQQREHHYPPHNRRPQQNWNPRRGPPQHNDQDHRENQTNLPNRQHSPPHRQNNYNNRRHNNHYNNYNRRGYNNNYQRNGGYRRNYNQRPQGGYRRNYNNNNRYNKRNPENQPGNAKFLAAKGGQEDKLEPEFDFDTANARFDKTDVYDEPAVAPVEQEQTDGVEQPNDGAENEENENVADPSAEAKESDVKDENEEEEKKSDPVKEEAAPKLVYTYNPAENFFDNLDANDGEQKISDLKTRRKLDAETFGEEAKTYSPKVFRRRRYRNNKGGRYNNRRNYNNNYNRRNYNNNYNNNYHRRNYNNHRNYNNDYHHQNHYNNNNQHMKKAVEAQDSTAV